MNFDEGYAGSQSSEPCYRRNIRNSNSPWSNLSVPSLVFWNHGRSFYSALPHVNISINEHLVLSESWRCMIFNGIGDATKYRGQKINNL